MKNINCPEYCNHLQIPLDYFVGPAARFPDRIRVWLYIAHYGQWLDYGSIANVLGMTVKDVKNRCSELVADGVVERAGGKARLLVAGLPDADDRRLATHRALMHAKKDRHIQVPLKVARTAADDALMALLKYRFTDEEYSFLCAHNAFVELQFWAKTFPDRLIKAGIVKLLMDSFPDYSGRHTDLAVLWCVRGAMEYVARGHKIAKLSGWILHVIGKIQEDGEKSSIWAAADTSDRTHLPTLAERLQDGEAEEKLGVVSAADMPDDEDVPIDEDSDIAA